MLISQPDASAKEFCAWTAIHRGNVTPEVTVDFLLPDYYGDIRRVLQVSATPRLDGTFREDHRLEYDGTVTFSILYLSEENCLRNLTFSEPFDGSIDVPDMNEESLVLVTPAVETATCRVQSPRKLTAKCKLQVGISVRHQTCLTPGFDGHYSAEDEATMQYDRTDVTTLRMLQLEEKDLSLSEEVALDSNLPAIGEIIRSDVTIHLQECRAGAGELLCRGDAILSVLYRTEGTAEEENYYALTKKIPLVCSLSHADLSDRFTCRAVATPATLKVMPETNSYGEMRTLAVDLSYDILALCSINDTRTITRDVFSTAYPCTGNASVLPVTRLIGCQRTNFSVNESKARTELGAEAASGVLQVLGDVKPDDLTYDSTKNRLCFTGKVAVCVLLQNGEEGGLSDATFTLPVRCELPCPQPIAAGEEFECTCKLIAAEGRLGPNNLFVNLEVALDVGIFSTEPVTLVDSVHLDTAHPFATDTPAMLLYYPHTGERLWEIAKTYHASPSAILAANHIDEGQLSGVPVLLIPRTQA